MSTGVAQVSPWDAKHGDRLTVDDAILRLNNPTAHGRYVPVRWPNGYWRPVAEDDSGAISAYQFFQDGRVKTDD